MVEQAQADAGDTESVQQLTDYVADHSLGDGTTGSQSERETLKPSLAAILLLLVCLPLGLLVWLGEERKCSE